MVSGGPKALARSIRRMVCSQTPPLYSVSAGSKRGSAPLTYSSMRFATSNAVMSFVASGRLILLR
jgi:hypothetical protein